MQQPFSVFLIRSFEQDIPERYNNLFKISSCHFYFFIYNIYENHKKKGLIKLDERLIRIIIDSFPKILIPGLKVTLPLTVIAFALALMIATAVALIQFANVAVLKQISRIYIWIIRGTPLLVQLYVVFFGISGMGYLIEPFICAAVVLAVNEGAYCAETIRAALESVSKGQIEAGYCVGMSYMQIIRRIVLPQALRTAFPPLSNSLLSMMKDTSLVACITVAEMFMSAQRIVARTYEPMAVYLEVAVIYLLFSTVLTWLQGIGEKYLNRYQREV